MTDSSLTKQDVLRKLDLATEKINVHLARNRKSYNPTANGNDNEDDEHGYFIFTAMANVAIPQMRDLLMSGQCLNVRDFWYYKRVLYGNVSAFPGFLDRLLGVIGVQKEDVNIYPDAKGTIVASKGIKFIFNQGQDDEDQKEYYPTAGCKIHTVPYVMSAFYKTPVPVVGQVNDLLDELNDEETEETIPTLHFESKVNGEERTPRWLLIFEKESWKDELFKRGFFKKHHAIAICTKGFARRNVYALVKMLYTRWSTGMTIVVFNDASPSGWDIMQKFYYMNSVGNKFSVPICMGGLLISEIVNDDQILHELEFDAQNFVQWDRACLRRLGDHPWTHYSAAGMKALNQFQLMNTHQKKWEMDSFKPPNGKSIAEYIIDILENEKYITGPNGPCTD